MKVIMMDINIPIPYARNPRKNNAAVDKVAASIKEFGFQQNIVIDKENVVVVGHTRLSAAKKLGLKEVPIIKADKLTPQQVKAYRIADNKTADFSEFDNELLILEIQELMDADYDTDLTGFSEDEIVDMDWKGSIFDDLDKHGIGINKIASEELGVKRITFDIDNENYTNYIKPYITKHTKAPIELRIISFPFVKGRIYDRIRIPDNTL